MFALQLLFCFNSSLLNLGQAHSEEYHNEETVQKVTCLKKKKILISVTPVQIVVLDFVDPNSYDICESYAGFGDLILLGLALVVFIFFSCQNPVSSLSPLLNETTRKSCRSLALPEIKKAYCWVRGRSMG